MFIQLSNLVHFAPTERDHLRFVRGYKHLAPLERKLIQLLWL